MYKNISKSQCYSVRRSILKPKITIFNIVPYRASFQDKKIRVWDISNAAVIKKIHPLTLNIINKLLRRKSSAQINHNNPWGLEICFLRLTTPLW